ncbi:MAG: cyclic nucleotide-binding domain-containing protein, partial [Deltaproteobacteria bacterium]|nr:cyclic nucleotide-binding domain-containing protein [Deltaproteobacteria bacterium]
LVLTSLMFFHRFPARRRAEIITRLQSRSISMGEKIIEEGKHNDLFYIILAGKVAVTLETGGQTVPLATLGKGNFFGEISMITGRPAIATVTAATDCLLVTMDKQVLDEVATQFPHFLRHVMEHLKQRNQETMCRMIESYQD